MGGPAHSGNEPLLRSFARSLRARNRSPKTISSYRGAARLLAAHAGDQDLTTLTRGDIEAFIAAQLQHHRPTTTAVRFRSLQQLYRWMVTEELIDASPMTGLRPPSVPEETVAVLDESALSRLLASVNGRSFEERRDTAIVRLFLDTGMRLAEMAGLQVTDIDLDQDVALVLGKGRRPRACPFGDKTGQAIERYLRERSKHRDAAGPHLWVGGRGVMTDNGIGQMLRRRAKEAGLAHLHPHMFAHRWLAEGGQEQDLMHLAGWRSRQMLTRYGASAADERAREAHRRLNLRASKTIVASRALSLTPSVLPCSMRLIEPSAPRQGG
jgi:site-specific recombinase XerD